MWLIKLYLFVLFLSFFIGGWKGFVFSYRCWLRIQLSYMSCILYLFVRWGEKDLRLKRYGAMMVLVAVLYFGASNIVLFYMLFEVVLFPMLVMIYYWGSQPEKISSIYYAVLYTRIFSIPFMWQLMKIEGWIYSLYLSPFSLLLFTGLFLRKIPIFGLSLWLPKAHVEAPTSARILLAGVLLKVGFYGFMKAIVLLNLRCNVVVVLSLMGILLAPFLAALRRDRKAIVAYSSVSHINLGLYGLNLVSNLTYSGGQLLSIRHGFIRAILFYFTGSFYSYNGVRILFYLTGLRLVSGFLALGVGISLLGNAGIPPLLSFWAELLIILTIFNGQVFSLFFLILPFIFSFYYSIYLLIHSVKRGGRSALRPHLLGVFLIGFLHLVNLGVYLI